MEYSFDTLAKKYVNSIRNLPEEYIKMISNTFNLDINTRVLDLGCGNGLLTFPIYNYSHNITGLDVSHNMIELARKRDKNNQIKWVQSDVLEYEFPQSYYDLIITYESMHLFPNLHQVIKNTAYGLRKGGFLCMGWCYYNWEFVLEQEIVDIFHKHGVDWGEWSYQRLDDFKKIIKSTDDFSFNSITEKYIFVQETWKVNEIVGYITSISKALTLDKYDIDIIKQELTEQLLNRYGENFIGDTQFWIKYAQKI